MLRSQWRPGRWWLPVLLLFLALPLPAHAHTTVKGFGEVLNGIAHPILTPAHLLLLIGLALQLGQFRPLDLKPFFLAFVPVSAIALLFTFTSWVNGVYQPVLNALALVIGGIVALERPLPPVARGILLAAAAVAIGLDSGIETGSTLAITKSLVGTWLCVNLFVGNLAFYISRGTDRKWLRVGYRVLGSWIVAISLLMLAFSLRNQ